MTLLQKKIQWEANKLSRETSALCHTFYSAGKPCEGLLVLTLYCRKSLQRVCSADQYQKL